MIKEGKFGVHETLCLLSITIGSKIFFTSPAFLVRLVGTTSWYTTLISDFGAIVGFTFIYFLLKRFPGKGLVEILNLTVGPFLGLVISLLFCLLFLLDAAVFLREFTEVMRIFTYPDTNSSIIEGVFVITVAIAAFLGLESIARLSKLFGYLLLASFLVVMLLSIRNFDYNNLFPILGNGIGNTLINGIKRSSAYGEVAVIAVFAGSLQGSKTIKKAGYGALLLSGTTYAIAFLGFLLTFSYPILQETTSPMYAMTRAIKYGTFLQRIDPLFLFLWTMASVITITVLFYCSVSIYCKTFRIQDSHPIVLPMAVLLFAAAITPKDFSVLVYGLVSKLRDFSWVVFYMIPFIVLIVAALRKKKGDASN